MALSDHSVSETQALGWKLRAEMGSRIVDLFLSLSSWALSWAFMAAVGVVYQVAVRLWRTTLGQSETTDKEREHKNHEHRKRKKKCHNF